MPQRLLLHIGLHKTGTSYLQNRVWPSWSAVGYAGRPTPKGHASSEEAVSSLKHPVILMSNESSGGSLKRAYLRGHSWEQHQLEKLQELKNRYFGKYELGVLIGLRHPEAWVVSIYKHYLKYGGVETMDGFLGLEDSPPTLAPEDLHFMPKLRRIEDVLGTTPFCFFLEEIQHQPAALSKALATYAGVQEGPEFTRGAALNEGVNQSEARICLKLNRAFINPGCLGRGYIKRNKDLAFQLARKCVALGLVRSSNPLEISPQASAFLRGHTQEDLNAVLGFISTQRAMAPNQLADSLGFNVPN